MQRIVSLPILLVAAVTPTIWGAACSPVSANTSLRSPQTGSATARKIAPPRTPASKPQVAPPVRKTRVGLPQDAGPHDAVSTIEWWYFNSFLTTESGGKYAVVGSFFRTGLPGSRKGHYLIYSLADLSEKSATAYSILDKSNLELLRSFLPLVASARPNDPRPLQLLATLQQGELPEPHQSLGENASLRTSPRFSIAFRNNTLSQATADARTWKANLSGGNWSLDLTLSQSNDRPAMLVGGEGKTGLRRPDDMYYVCLTRMDTVGTLVLDGVIEKVTGVGWLDRQWGRSWVVENNGWDWFGVQLSDGSDLIVYRIRDNKTGKILRQEATLLSQDGKQTVDRSARIRAIGTWTDPVSRNIYPAGFEISLPTIGHTLSVTPAFPDQTIPVLGIGDAIWEGVVNVKGTDRGGSALTGQGYMELVGYEKKRVLRTAPRSTSDPETGGAPRPQDPLP